MAEQNASQRIPVTVQLSPAVAMRLKMAAEARKLSAADLAADLLDRYLPRLPSSEPKKGNIPYA
jgi:hypothetical protein